MRGRNCQDRIKEKKMKMRMENEDEDEAERKKKKNNRQSSRQKHAQGEDQAGKRTRKISQKYKNNTHKKKWKRTMDDLLVV